MKDVRKTAVEAEEENVLQLQVVARQNGAADGAGHPPSLNLAPRVHARRRPELAALGWERRVIRLTAGK